MGESEPERRGRERKRKKVKRSCAVWLLVFWSERDN